ncbi:MAG: hypothetical protein ABNH49_10385 [Hyphomonas sp.]|jgi:hypothetical protein
MTISRMWRGAVRKCALGLVASLLIVACDRAGSPYVESVKDLPKGFFRVHADIRVKETGELVKLDYVVSCGGKVTNWTYTTPSVTFGMAPQIMLVPTQSGELIGARTPEVCDASMWEPKRITPKGKPEIVTERVPDDFLPLLMWYPNADDIGFAIGYLSDKAYDSPYAKIEVLDSGIARSSLEEWRAWRKKAAAEFEQVGALPGPWGHQIPGTISSSVKLHKRLRAINHGRPVDTGKCNAATVIYLPEDAKSEILPLLPQNGAPWVPLEQLEDERREQIRAILRTLSFNGTHYYAHGQIVSETGVRRSTGGGAFLSGESGKKQGYHDYFPVVPFQPSEIDPASGEIVSWYHQILFDERWSGFGICGRTSPGVAALTEYSAGRTKVLHPDYTVHRANGVFPAKDWVPEVLVDENNVIFAPRVDGAGPWFIVSGSGRVFDRDGRLISYCCAR